MLAVLLLASALSAEAQENKRIEAVVEHLDTMVETLKSATPRHVLRRNAERRREFAENIYAAAAKWDICPVVLAATMFFESSYDMVSKGTRGEIGLTQVHGLAAKGCDLATEIGQMECGARWLAVNAAKCGYDLERTLTGYASGSCVSESPTTHRKIRYRIKRIKKWMK